MFWIAKEGLDTHTNIVNEWSLLEVKNALEWLQDYYNKQNKALEKTTKKWR